MAKNSIRDFSATAASNTDIQSVDIDENCAASGINNAIRELMADLADVNAGTVAMTSPSADSLSTDTISEKTSGSGVTIDSVLLKDGALGSIASAVAAHLTSINGGQIGGNRNLIINGAMQVAQRGTSTTSITSDAYPACDRWHTQINSCGTWTASQSTTVPSGEGFTSSFKLECTTADASPAAGDYVLLNQRIEAQNLQHLAFGTSSAKAVTLSFWIRSNKTGTIATEIYHHDASKHFNSNFTINSADTWEHKKITIDGNTADIINNDNGYGFIVYWWFASGSDYNTSQSTGSWNNTNANRATTYNLADTVGNEVYVTGVQLEVGSTATEFQHESYGETLSKCQRYYFAQEQVFEHGYAYQGVAGGHGLTSPVFFPTTMRAAPTVTASNIIDGGSGTTMKFNLIKEQGMSIEAEPTVNDGTVYVYADVAASAEL